nr:lyase family protein [Nocardioides aromaticivorans]
MTALDAPLTNADAPLTRTEHDSLGPFEVPATAYWGVHTARAVRNFPISGTPVGAHRQLVAALGAVKLAAARANHELGLLDDRRYDAIAAAAQEVRDGALDDQLVVDVIQGGAGTSTNMNANEVVANRALEILGLPFGSYDEVHPLDHVNRCQSTTTSTRPPYGSRSWPRSTGSRWRPRRWPTPSRARRPSSAPSRRSGARSCRTRSR